MTRKCQSKSKYGNCGLASRHSGPHAVPIGPDNDGGTLYFGYSRRTHKHFGYGWPSSEGWRLA